MSDIVKSHEAEFQKVIDHYLSELSTLRTGRASTGILSTVQVESYGTRTPLEHVASVAVQDARTIAVTPWDKSLLPSVEKAILASNLGVTPSNDGNVIRISLPPMSEERRKELVKVVGQLEEKARVGVRNVREDVLKEMKRGEGDGGVSKDDISRGQKQLQDVVDKLNSEIKQHASAKEKEIMTV